jgi:hypothetical protein
MAWLFLLGGRKSVVSIAPRGGIDREKCAALRAHFTPIDNAANRCRADSGFLA